MASLTDFVDFSSKPLLCELASLRDLNNLHVIDPNRVRRDYCFQPNFLEVSVHLSRENFNRNGSAQE